ncbi:hypothetical protein NECAME_04535 [Necator americanus]|uniref:Vitellogenin domain-containing protein n=1 Tax=Necator americanus TaxID=51031 RepID=W2SQP9_NECAM|nr:hypothetical protein NECAME_04535 [Necator americanus]ETN72064.1 hypothetical protein NECAME_04535 [Necator americanus]
MDEQHITMRFALLALVGVALGVHHTLDQNLLKPRREYVFRFEGDVHSGIPLPTESEISRIEALVHVQTPDDHNALLKLREIRFATGKDERKENFKNIEDLQIHEITKKHMELLELPVKFGYRDGMVSELQFHSNDETWSKNVKRSIINMLQLNLHKMGRTEEMNRMERYENVRENDNDYFTATERTIEGIGGEVIQSADMQTKMIEGEQTTLKTMMSTSATYEALREQIHERLIEATGSPVVTGCVMFVD